MNLVIVHDDTYYLHYKNKLIKIIIFHDFLRNFIFNKPFLSGSIRKIFFYESVQNSCQMSISRPFVPHVILSRNVLIFFLTNHFRKSIWTLFVIFNFLAYKRRCQRQVVRIPFDHFFFYSIDEFNFTSN